MLPLLLVPAGHTLHAVFDYQKKMKKETNETDILLEIRYVGY